MRKGDRSFGNQAIFIDDVEDLPDFLIPPEPTLDTELESIFGTLGDNDINLTNSNHLVFAGDGDDIVRANEVVNNRIYGGSGNNTFTGNSNNRVFGNDGEDRFLISSEDNNTFTGSAGADEFRISNVETPDTPSMRFLIIWILTAFRSQRQAPHRR